MAGFLAGFFGVSPPDPKEQAKKWIRDLKSQMRHLDREIRAIEIAEVKTKTEVKKLAKKGELTALRVLAKELVRSGKAKVRLFEAKARLNSVQMQLTSQVAMQKVAGALGKSTEIMKSMSALVSVPQLTSTIREMGAEMAKAGVMEELVSDAMAGLEDDGEEAEADEEVDRVVMELTAGIMGGAGLVPTGAASATAAAAAAAVPAAAADADDPEMVAMKARLEAL